jgi:hypothetical protein
VPPPGGTPPGGAPPQDDGNRGWLIALGVGLVIAVGLLVLVLATGGDDEEPAQTTPTAITVVRPTVTEEERTIETQVQTQVQTVVTPPETVTEAAPTVTVQRTTTVVPGGTEAP